MKKKLVLILVNVIGLAAVVVGSVVPFTANYVLAIVGAFAMACYDTFAVKEARSEMEDKVVDADNKNVAKTDFLSSMSHSIRTPMNAVIGMTNIARENIDNKEVVEDCLKKINLSGRNLVTLINDILDFSKVESGKYQLTTSVFSLEEQISYLQSIISEEANDKGVKINVDTTKAKYDSVYSDEIRLNQVLLNVLSNAIDYNKENGSVSIEVTEKEIPSKEDKVELVYKISDTGIGMSKDFVKKVFDAYSRAVDTRVDKVNGSGLGMYITKKLVDMLDGTITVESQLGEGTVFTITVEVEVGGNILSKEKEKDTTQFENLHILVVEDNELNYEILSKTLEQHGVTMDHAENGKIAVEMMKVAKHDQYRLILMDIEMPELNGYDATKAIRQLKDAEIASTPIYAITADAFSEDVKKAKEAGMNGHISKPVDFDKVIAVLKKNK